jgi:hypothetical protein
MCIRERAAALGARCSNGGSAAEVGFRGYGVLTHNHSIDYIWGKNYPTRNFNVYQGYKLFIFIYIIDLLFYYLFIYVYY